MAVPFSDEQVCDGFSSHSSFLSDWLLSTTARINHFPVQVLALDGLSYACNPGFDWSSSAKADDIFAHFVMLSGLGGFGLVAGVYQLAQTQRDVLVAPYSGMMFCVGVVGLMVSTWDDLSTVEQWAGFLTIVVLGGGETWLIFRGLLIGKLPRAWSQAGMVALMQGRLTGRNGAIECFEKGWDADEEHLNPMAYVALHRIHIFLGQDEEAQNWKTYLDREGGESAVAREYIQAIHDALADLDSQAAERLPVLEVEESE